MCVHLFPECNALHVKRRKVVFIFETSVKRAIILGLQWRRGVEGRIFLMLKEVFKFGSPVFGNKVVHNQFQIQFTLSSILNERLIFTVH